MATRLNFFTIVARNYLAYAYVLGDSIKQYQPDAVFSIFVMDDVTGEHCADVEAKGFTAILPDQIDLPNYKQFVFKYNITEASTGVKPFVFQHLLNAGFDKIVYLDPDILCYRPLSEVTDALDTCSIVLTPHSTSPIDNNLFPDDHLFLISGVYNLGFIALRNDSVAQKFIRWWSQRLENECLDAQEMSLFVDQKWVDLVPAYFENVLIFKSLAYNIAYWNLHEREIRRVADHLRVFPSDELVAFIHFSGMLVGENERISKYGPRSPFDDRKHKQRYSFADRPDLIEPFGDYAQRVTHAGHARYVAIPYAFDRYTNGDKITQLERAMYFASPEWQADQSDPFAATVGSFWHACRTARIKAKVSRGTAQAAPVPTEFGPRYQIVFRTIQFMLRLIVRVLGPEMYAKFAKYMREQFLLVNHTFLLRSK